MIRTLSDYNWTQTHNHLVRKRTLNQGVFTLKRERDKTRTYTHD